MSTAPAGVLAMSAYAIPPAVTSVLMLGFGAGVFFRRRSPVGNAFFLLTLTGSAWLLAFTFMFASAEANTALFWARAAYVGVPFLPAAIYQFTVEILGIASRRRWATRAAWAAGAFFSVSAIATDWLITGVEKYSWGYYPQYARAFSIPFLTYFFGYLLFAVVEFLRAYPRSRGIERRRIRILIAAFGVAYFGSVDYLPKYGIDIYPFGYIPILMFVGIIALAMRRYDLVPITPSIAAREIIGTMADALFVCDAEGRIRSVNTAAEMLLGYGSDEMIGRRIEDFLQLRSEDAEITASMRRRVEHNMESTFMTRSGETVEMTLSVAPVVHERETAGAVIIGRDMRDRKRAERDVLHAVTLLRSTLDSTADGILVTGDDGHVLTYNQRFLDLWKIPSEALERGDDTLVLENAVDQLRRPEEFRQTIAALRLQQEAQSFDLLEFVDGRRLECYSTGRQIGTMDRMRVWSFRDVTSRHAAEAALRDSEMRYRLLFEQNAAGVYVTNTAGTILDCNTTFTSFMGFPRARLIGMNIRNLYQRPFELDELVALLNDVQSLNSVEVELRKEDGKSVWVLQNLVRVGSGESAVMHTTVVDISDRKRAEEQIEFHAYHDVLTQLPNRKLFTDRLTTALSRAKRAQRAVAVMFIDLDHFKTVNDTLGHTAGDELLLEMAQRLKLCIREEDTVARVGGDEFTIILSDLRHPEDAASVAQKILDTVEQPVTIAGTPIDISASIGIALYPNDGKDAESLLRNADSAMYRAKEAGRSNYQLCTDDLKKRAVERLSIERRLRRAIQEGQLLLHYQPQVHLRTGKLSGAEALVRWNDPERGLVPPSMFIPMAEESRLIIPLGEWVLRTACVHAREWIMQGIDPVRVAVNLSPRQFQQHDLVQMVRSALDDARLPPESLELEITETTAMLNSDVTVDVLRALRDIGVGISIDDFGTGYSSLNYLKRFPINALKIDASFIRDMMNNGGDAAIVAAVIGIARSLDLRVVAEGVEMEDQVRFLQRRNCDEAQGFYFSTPMAREFFGGVRQSFDLPAQRAARLSI